MLLSDLITLNEFVVGTNAVVLTSVYVLNDDRISPFLIIINS